MVCDKVVLQRWCVTKRCEKMVSERWCVRRRRTTQRRRTRERRREVQIQKSKNKNSTQSCGEKGWLSHTYHNWLKMSLAVPGSTHGT